MKKIVKCIIPAICVSFAASVCSAQTLIHRYAFNSNANDGVGTLNGTVSTNTSTTEAPNYTTNTPTGANTSFAANSIQLGMNKGSSIASFVNFGAGPQTKIFDGKSGSWSLWFNTTGISSGNPQEVFSNVTVLGANALRTNINGATGAVQVINTTATPTTPSTAAASNGSWNHLALTWNDTTGAGTIGLNGTVTSFTLTPGTLLDPSRLILGNFAAGNTNMATQFVGQFYDLQIYDGVLSNADISFLNSNPGVAIPEPSTYALMLAGLVAVLVAKRRRTA